MDDVGPLESALRNLVERARGDEWKSYLKQSEIRQLESRESTDQSKRQGRLQSGRLIEQLDFGKLLEIIERHFDDVMTILGTDREVVSTYFKILLRYRNPAAHSRELLNFERAHVTAITTELLNNIAIHRSRTEFSTTYYPVIVSAVDLIGQTPSDTDFRRHDSGSPGRPPHRLEAGEGTIFTCTGIDPKGRQLYWSVSNGTEENGFDDNKYSFDNESITRSEQSIQLPWKPNPDLYGEIIVVKIYLRSDSAYHKHKEQKYLRDLGPSYDDVVIFYYSVNPPLE